MDRNSIIGLILIFIILLGYSFFMQPSEEQIANRQRIQDSIALVRQTQQQYSESRLSDSDVLKTQQLSDLPESTRKDVLVNEYGPFAGVAEGKQEFFTIENNLMSIKLSSKGGRPYSVRLKEYTRYNGSPLILFDGDSTRMGFQFFSGNRSIMTNNLYFEPAGRARSMTVSSDSASFALRLNINERSYLEYVYTLRADDYMVGCDVRFVNMGGIIASNSTSLEMEWSFYVPQQEKGAQNENNHTAIQYRFANDNVEEFSTSKDSEKQNLKNKIQWIAFKQQFFSSVLINNNNFIAADLSSEKLENNPDYLKHYSALALVDFDPKSNIQEYPLSFYFGPNKFSVLNQYEGMELGRLVQLGGTMFRFINKYIILTTFNFLNKYISNYGIIILILTILIKVVLYPLTKKSFDSMAKMRVLKPKVDELSKKFSADKAMEKQQAVAALYKKAGVNPMGGCLPMLLQLPILIAMFRFFPASIELRQEAFLWADDLSTYDSILNLPFSIPFYGDHVSLFTLLMTITTILSTKLNSGNTDSSAMPGMKSMMYIMPVMFMFMFNSFPAALTYYYLLTNIISIAQNEIMRRMIDEEALLKQLTNNKAKPVQKSKFQQRMEEMAKKRGYKMN